MTTFSITHYLQDSHALGNLLSRLKTLNSWNEYLAGCLAEEKNLVQHCQIVNLVDKTLVILTDSPQWATRIRFYIPQLIPKLKNCSGLENVQAIQCKVYPATHLSRLQQISSRRV